MEKGQTCASLYEILSVDRQHYLDRARDAALVTIPSLVPPDGHNSSTKYYVPYQSVGARLLNNLSATLLFGLFPPNTSVLKLTVDDYTTVKLSQDKSARAKVDESFNRFERAVMTEVETMGIRPPTFEMLRQLIVAGNVTFYTPGEGRPRIFRLDSYVCRRDPVGNLMDWVGKEEVSFGVLSDEEKEFVSDSKTRENNERNENTVVVFTRYYRDGNKYKLYQEIEGHRVPSSEGEWDLDKGPILALRWNAINGEDYGRSYVDEYIGDLSSLEALTKAILEGAAASAKMLWLVNPNGTTRMRDIANAPNCAVVQGNSSEVTVLQAQKHADFSTAVQTADKIIERLSFAFLMNASVQRNAERVTAEEIRFVASQLENSLGGVYSILSQEFQLPFINRIIDRMVKQKKLPKLPDDIVRPIIVTGLEALGRGHDLTKYQTFFSVLGPLGLEIIQQHINVSDLVKRVGTSLGIDMTGLVKTEEQLQAEREEAQRAQMQSLMASTAGKMLETATPETIKGIREEMQVKND